MSNKHENLVEKYPDLDWGNEWNYEYNHISFYYDGDDILEIEKEIADMPVGARTMIINTANAVAAGDPIYGLCKLPAKQNNPYCVYDWEYKYFQPWSSIDEKEELPHGEYLVKIPVLEAFREPPTAWIEVRITI